MTKKNLKTKKREEEDEKKDIKLTYDLLSQP